MKKWVVVLFICCLANNFSQTNISPQFSELKGMEDQLGNTHLFYRIYSETYGVNSFSRNNDIYRLSLNSMVDTIFLHDWIYSSPVMESAKFVYDYDFWNTDYSEYIFCGLIGLTPEPVAYVERFDGQTNYYQWGEINKVEVSEQNDSLIYAGGDIFSSLEKSIKSVDGGWNWLPINDTLKFISLNPFNDDILFFENDYGLLYRSTDAGNTFNLVDLLNQPAYSTSFLYDLDQLHIYRLFGNQTLRASPNKGEPFSWLTKYSSDSEIFISNDELISGTIYLADKKNILVSTDYCDNFSLYKTLDRNIVGIYKKPNSNKVYAATKYKIYEITPDIVQIIKSLSIPEEVLNYYPLTIGNYWVYSVYTNEGGNNIYWGDESKNIVDTLTMSNGLSYFLFQRISINSSKDTTYLRLDSLTGKLYAYSFETSSELFFEDLLAEEGDTVCYEFNPAWNCQFVQPDSQFTEFGLNTIIKKYFPQAPGWYFGHSLVSGIGLYEVYNGDLTTYQSILKGCVIDGVVYGDTLTVGVEDEETQIVNEFKLEQNFPNPFNPSTVISYWIPVSSNVTLKVYDVLGNEIATLVNEELPAGEYEVEFQSTVGSRQLTSGIYFYQLKAGAFIQSKKMLLLK